MSEDNKAEVSILNSYLKKRNKPSAQQVYSLASESIRSQLSDNKQQKKPGLGSGTGTDHTRSNFLDGAENRYDPEGEVSAICRPLLKDQKAKLENLLATEKKGKNGGGAGTTKRSGETELRAVKDTNFTSKIIG